MGKTQTVPPESLVPLTPPVFHILLSLVEDARHGYAIMQDVAEQTNGVLTLGPGTLYGCLKRMVDAGLVQESEEANGEDERRRYYRMTALGRRVLGAEAERLSKAVGAAKTRGVLGTAGARV